MKKHNIASIKLDSPECKLREFFKRKGNFFIVTDYRVRIHPEALLINTLYSAEKVRYIMKENRIIEIEDFVEVLEWRDIL